MKIKLRVIISLFLALAIMSPVIIQQPNKILGILLFIGIAFIILFTITSLFNIQNMVIKISLLTVTALLFFIKLYSLYSIKGWILPKAIVSSLAFTVVFVLIFRGITLLIEKDKQTEIHEKNIIDEN